MPIYKHTALTETGMHLCSTPSQARTFVLGVGAQKAGTTWLHQYLAGYPCADFGMHKEYHIWDAVFLESCAEFKVAPETLITDSSPLLTANDPNILRYSMQQFPGVYPGYFANLLSGEKWLTGDITPAYAGLSVAALHQVKGLMVSAGMQVKVIFLMRDPFERCWSAVRMYKRTTAMAGSDEDCLAQCYRSEQFRFRTAYDETIQRLEQVFPSDAIFYGFYENLFTKATLDRLSDFLGIAPNYSAIDQRFNQSPKSERCRPELKAAVKNFYSDVYAYCHERFPGTRALWKN